MEPIITSKFVKCRAILAKSGEVEEKKGNANVHVTPWYEEEPPFEKLIADAKEKGCDLLQIELVTTESKIFEVK